MKKEQVGCWATLMERGFVEARGAIHKAMEPSHRGDASIALCVKVLWTYFLK